MPVGYKRGDAQNGKFVGFVEFYPEEMSLNNNIDGSVMVYLLGSEDFLDWVSDQTGLPEFGTTRKFDLCKIAGYATFKCYLGGVANFLCHVAVGVSFACLVVDIIDWFTEDVIFPR